MFFFKKNAFFSFIPIKKKELLFFLLYDLTATVSFIRFFIEKRLEYESIHSELKEKQKRNQRIRNGFFFYLKKNHFLRFFYDRMCISGRLFFRRNRLLFFIRILFHLLLLLFFLFG